MKKILAIAIVTILTVALCISASAKTSFDRISVNHNVLTEMGNDISDGTLTIAKGDKVYILGWALNDETNSTLKEVVWTCDGQEKKCDENYRDRTDVAQYFGLDAALGIHAGIGQDDNAFELTGMDKLGDGTYAVEIIAKYNDGTQEVLGNGAAAFTLVVGTGIASEQPGSSEGGKTITVDLSSASGNIDVQYVDGKVVCTTTGGDPWVSIPLDNIDTSVYNYVTVTYTATAEVGSNNTYLMDTSVNPGYSGTAGTWHPHGMEGTADGQPHSVTYCISEDFPTMAGTTLTGIRFTCCGDMDGVFTVESVVFSDTDPAAQQGGENPGSGDAAIIAIAAVGCVALAGVVVAKKVK